MAMNLEPVPDLVCGRSYRDAMSEAIVFEMRRRSGYRLDGGCLKPMTWVNAYRCRECGRWMHGECLDTHFAESQHDSRQPAQQEGGQTDDA